MPGGFRMKKLHGFLLISAVTASIFGASILGNKKAEHVCAEDHIHNGQTFTEWTSDNSLPTAGGNYYLTKDVTITSTWSPASGARICLNGFGIRQAGTGNVISIGGNLTFSVYDCNNTVEHKFKIDESGLATVDDTFESEYETFNGGYITGGHGGDKGGGVYLVPGSKKGNTTQFYMYGGTIIGNSTTGNGGGINYAWKSKMNSIIELYNTTIIGNVADGMGGGIFHQANNRRLVLDNTKILRNVAGQSAGGVLEQSELRVYGNSYIFENRLKNGNPSDINLGHSGGQPDNFVIKNELSPTSKFGIDYIRTGVITDYYKYNSKDANEVFITHNDKLWTRDGDNAVYDNINVTTYTGPYDGEPHSMSVALEDPSIEHEIKYGLEQGTYDLDVAPSYVLGGKYKVYYRITSKLNTAKGSTFITIIDPEMGDPVRDQIDAIHTPISYPESVEEVKAAREAYNALFDDSQRERVTNLDKLVEYETTLATLRSEIIDELIAKIDEIPNEISDKETYVSKVDAATAIFEQLTESDKESEDITNLEKYLEALNNYDDIAASNEVVNIINQIPQPVTYTSQCIGKINEAKEAYEALTPAQQQLVENSDKLFESESSFLDLRNDLISDLISKINEIPDAITDKDAYLLKVDAATEAFEKLLDEDKESTEITNLDKYLEALEKCDDIAAAKEVISLIEEIPEPVVYSTECIEIIDEAKDAYNALTEAQKELVDNYDKLLAAIEALNAKKEEATSSLTEKGVTVETGDGTKIPSNIQLKVEVNTSVSAEEGSADYEAIKSKIGSEKQISGVYEVKLILTDELGEHEIQPSDIKEGMTITVTMAIPSGVNGEFEILHIHSLNDIDYLTNYSLNGSNVSFSLDKLSEFAFITKVVSSKDSEKGSFPGWAIALIVIFSILLVICGAYFLLFFVFNKWIKEEDDATRVFKFGKKDDKVRLFRVPFNLVKKEGKIKFVFKAFKFVYVEENKVFPTKEEALK